MSSPKIVCPFLGLKGDPASCHSYPSEANHCYRRAEAASVQRAHQDEFCLASRHTACPLYLDARAATPMLLGKKRIVKRRVSQRNVIALAIALLVIFLLEQQWMVSRRAVFSAPATASQTAPLPTASQTPAPTNPAVTFTLPPSATPTLHLPFFGSVTVVPSPTPGASATFIPYQSKHQLGLPIGAEKQFVIRRLEAGATLEPYLLEYDTTLEAVKQINYDLLIQSPTPRDILIIFPYRFFDVSGLKTLEIYQTKEAERGANYGYLAFILHVDLEEFKWYNGIASFMERPLVGDYYLVPQRRVIP